MRSTSEKIWYYVFMLCTCFLGLNVIMRLYKPDSIVPYIVFGAVLGLLWGGIWKRTFARLFDEKKDGDEK
jgi:uncharacterized membrane protein YqgA involved in biofilm formation